MQVIERKCPKCHKDYSRTVNWVQSLEKHLARKNPCDSPPGTKYIRELKVPDIHVPSLDSIVWKKSKPSGLLHCDVGPWVLRDVFSKRENICFVQPNIAKNEIIVKVSKDRVITVTIDGFIKEFVNHVFLKRFDFTHEEHLRAWLRDNCIDTDSEWDGTFPETSIYFDEQGYKIKIEPDFMIHMRRAIRAFSIMQTSIDRYTIKRALIHFREDSA